MPEVAEPMPSTAAERLAGAFLARSGPALAGLGVLVGVLAAVLVPVGGWRPLLAVPLLVLLAAAAAPALRAVPARPVPSWTVAGVVGLAAGHAVWAALTHAQQVVLRRDAGSYALYTQWIAQHHGLPIPSRIEAFGGAAALADPAFRLASPAFFFVGDGHGGGQIVPQFLLGAPAVFSLGWWAHGWGGLFVVPAVVSGCALLAVGSLAARLCGPSWAVLVVATLAVAQPMLHAARSTYSEPLALLLLAGAAALLVDAVRASSGRLAWAAGLGFGLVGLVRVDAVREVALLLPVAAALALRRHPAARGVAVGALVGLALAAAPAVLLSRPYLAGVRASLLPLLAGGAVLGLLSLAAVARLPRTPADQGKSDRPPGRLNTTGLAIRLATGVVLLVGLVLAVRPLFLTTRQSAADPGSRVVAGLQARQGLPVDGGRTYAEHSVAWLNCYLGPVTLLAALLAFAVLAGGAVRWWRSGPVAAPGWLAPAVVGFGASALTLYRPGITPDHPWADRRMVPLVLPTLVIAAAAALAWAARTARRRWSAPVLIATVVVGAASLPVPALLATLPVAGPAARTERGEPGAVRSVCAALRPDDAVLALDARAANEWPQVIRGVCGVPAASIRVASPDGAPAAVRRITGRIAASGHRPVLLAGAGEGTAIITAVGEKPSAVVDLRTREDQRFLTRRPDGVDPLRVQVWLARP